MITHDNFLLKCTTGLTAASICRKTISFENHNTILLKYVQGTLSFYVVQNDREFLCSAVSIDLPNFYLMLSSTSQPKHSLSIDVSSLLFTTAVNNTALQFDVSFVHRSE